MLYTIFKVRTKVRNDFGRKKFTVHEVSYPEESDMPRLNKRGSTAVRVALDVVHIKK